MVVEVDGVVEEARKGWWRRGWWWMGCWWWWWPVSVPNNYSVSRQSRLNRAWVMSVWGNVIVVTRKWTGNFNWCCRTSVHIYSLFTTLLFFLSLDAEALERICICMIFFLLIYITLILSSLLFSLPFLSSLSLHPLQSFSHSPLHNLSSSTSQTFFLHQR